MDSGLLLNAKLSKPRASRWYLPRPHLDALLTEGMGRKLTALIAAAGHGKTCTLANFLSQTQKPHLWLQLDPTDSNEVQFLYYLALGISRELQGGSRLLQALENGSSPSHALPLLIADLNDCPADCVLVLDDFHLIDKNSPVVQLLAGLVQYSEQGLHLFICSRSPLPFSIARLKVIQEASELTEVDLRFTAPETKAYLEQMAGISLTEAELAQICHLTEGWSAALVLLAATMKRRGKECAALDGPLPADLFSYLSDEVFFSLPVDLQTFMEDSSILDVCSPVTCDAILERRNSAAILSFLLNSNLLLTQLGPDSFRYHHLLQRFLQERLKVRDSGESFERVHRKAAEWYLSRHVPEEAVRYYIRGGLLQEAAVLVEEMAPVWLRTSRLDRLREVLTFIPNETKEQYPWITLCESRISMNAGNADVAMGMGRLALRVFQARNDPRGIVQTLSLLCELLIARQQYDAAMEVCQQAAAVIGPEHRWEEAVLLHRRAALSLLTKGANPDAERDLRRSLSLYAELGDLPGEAAVSDSLGLVRAFYGDYTTTIRLLERCTEIRRSLGDPSTEIGTNLAWIYSHLGRYTAANAICEPMLASSSRKMQRAYAAVYLLHNYTRLGDFAKAAAMAQAAHVLVEELGHRELKATLAVDLAGLYRLSGQSQTAISYAKEAMQLAKQSDRANFQIKPVTEAVLLHLFFTGNNASALRMAEKLLSRLPNTEAHPFERMLITFTLAIAEFRQSRTESRPEGVRLLQEALAECSRRGYEFFALHEWPLALSIVIYGLAYRVQTDFCLDLMRLLDTQLPEMILQQGITLMDHEAKLIPAAWQAIPDDRAREAFARLLTPADRRRVVGLATGPAPVRIQCLGALSVTVGTDTVDIRALKKRKSGLLLILLLTQDGPWPRDQVIDRLWPEMDAQAADTSLRVTLHHLRRLLEPHLGGRSKSRYIQAEGGLIWFSRQPEVNVDLDQFRAAIEQAETTASDGDLRSAATQYEAACKLYRGDLSTDDPYSSAIEDIRNALRERFAAALDWLGDYYWQEVQDHSKAILVFKQRLTLDEAHESAHQALIRLYLENGQVAAARQQYTACREALLNQLGVTPSRATESLMQLAISMESDTVFVPPASPASKRKK